MMEFFAQTLDEVLAIEKAGGDRILLSSAVSEGGITPSIGFTVLALGAVSIPVDVMIRPHSAGFCYSYADMDVIEADLYAAVETKASRVVLGMLDSKGDVNINLLERLIPKVRDKGIVFGRAIDYANHIAEAAKTVSQYEEVKAVLTSGGFGSYKERLENIRAIHEAAPELEIIVYGMHPDNIPELATISWNITFLASENGFDSNKTNPQSKR